MRAFQLATPGGPPGLTDLPIPEPGPGAVRIRVAACGLNFADLLMIRGEYQERPVLPFTLGMEVSGTVDGVGPGVTAPLPGARVAAFAGTGGLAEWACVPADRCIPLPDSIAFATAAAFPVAYGTSHLALTEKARLQPGETLLVLGAAGGVGLTAVELGHQMGARVIAVARGADRLAIAHRAGADLLIDPDQGSLRDQIKALGGADVVFDPVGGNLFTEALRATNPNGRIVVVGFASGTVPPIPGNILLVKNIAVLGLYWGGYLTFRPDILTGSLATLADWLAGGRIAPHISHILPLSRVTEALDLLASRTATGKIVISMAPE